MVNEHRGPAILTKAFIFTLWFLPAICALQVMWTHWVAVPFWDEWYTPGAQLASYYKGTLSLADLFSQHNEHRLFFPRLVWLPMAILAGQWDVRHEMLLTLCLVCVGSAGLYQLLRASGGSPAGRAFVFGLMNLLLFSPRQYETFLVGAQGQTFWPTLALVFALLMNLSRSSLAAKTMANTALAFVGSYSFGNGMLIWLLAFPLQTRPAGDLPARQTRTRIFWRAVYILSAVISVAGYFLFYQHPPYSPPVVSPIARFPEIVRFVVVWIGSLFTVGAPEICGALLLLFLVGLTTAAVRQTWRTGEWQPHYPWLILACYTLISAGIAAVARLGFDHSMAGDSRYTTFSVFFYIALLGLGWSASTQAKPPWLSARLRIPVAIALLLLVLTPWGITFKAERKLLRRDYQARRHTELVVRWLDAIPQNPEIVFFSPYPPQETLDTIRTIAARGALRPRLVSHALANAVNEPPNATNASAGILEQATHDGSNRVFCKGWARVPDQDRPADCVVLGFETDGGRWQPFCVLETGGKRMDLADKSESASLVAHAGFSRSVYAKDFPRDGATMQAWAIDLRNERAFPMSGAIKVETQP